MTKRELVSELAKKTGASQRETAKMVDAFADVLSDELAKGEMVKLNGFGSFQVRHRAARKGRNPVTGEEMPVPPTTVVVFKPSGKLAESVAAIEDKD